MVILKPCWVQIKIFQKTRNKTYEQQWLAAKARISTSSNERPLLMRLWYRLPFYHLPVSSSLPVRPFRHFPLLLGTILNNLKLTTFNLLEPRADIREYYDRAQQKNRIKLVSRNIGGAVAGSGFGHSAHRLASPLALGSVLEDADGNYCLYTLLVSSCVSEMCFLINAPKSYLCITALHHPRVPVHRQGRSKVRGRDCHDCSRPGTSPSNSPL